MRKKTVYNVTGVLDTKPSDLPEGLKVDELLVDDLESVDIGSFTFQDSSLKENGVFIRENRDEHISRHLTKDQTTSLRDFLNTVLGETPKIRVVKDADGDVWFELETDKWTLGSYVNDKDALTQAKRKLKEKTPYHNCSFEYVNNNHFFGPVNFIENTWE